MRETVITRDGRAIELPTEEEDREIIEAALADPDAQPWTEEELAKVRPMRFPFTIGSKIELFVISTSEEEQK